MSCFCWQLGDPRKRPTIRQLQQHPWIKAEADKFAAGHLTKAKENIRKYQVRKRLKKGIMGVMFANKIKNLVSAGKSLKAAAAAEAKVDGSKAKGEGEVTAATPAS